MSIAAYQQALIACLQKLDMPVYLQGQVPARSPFPYLTCAFTSGAFAAQSSLTLTAWFQGKTANTARAALCDQARALFPEEGLPLIYSGGMAVLHRSGGDFITLLCDAQDPRILGARIRLMAKNYDL